MISIPLLTISSGFGVLKKTFHIFPSDKIILRGASGCGKSSLAKLIGGIELSYEIDLTVKWHGTRKPSVSYLDQNSWSIGTDLVEEISFYENTNSLSHERLAKASYCAGISEDPLNFVPNQPFDSFSSSLSLSGGQLRRLSLARVLYIPSSLIILDEPTASLHQSSKDSILQRLVAMYTNETIINISHDSYRMSDEYRILDL